ncbi:MAG: DUF1318 domain-containing protein [Deltaproteobacteria bacterium]|nr:MAG: DUF1318 domain-containing protein [Deltaproteobacteria bacterium]
MKRHVRPVWVLVLCMVILIFACVTINIYFPAEKVESVAGDIVNDIRGPRSGEEEKPQGKDKSSLIRNTLLALSPSLAWAQEVTEVSNPTIRALKQSMRSRYNQMKPYYQKGMLKEGNNGYVSLANTGGLGLKEKRDLNALVDAENSDRKTLYVEVAKALKVHPIDSAQINRVAEIFAKEWQKSVR